MDKPSDSPAVPTRTSLKPPPIAHRRRRSLPSNASGEPSHRSVNRVNVQPASPEVISSLIQTLSAISTPAESHFENLPHIGSAHTAPSSPNIQVEHSRGHEGKREPSLSPSKRSFGLHRRSRKNMNETQDNAHLHPQEAALPPVVRMGKGGSSPSPSPGPSRFPRKAKSGESFLTAREDQEKRDEKRSSILSNSMSAVSIESLSSSGRKPRPRAQKLVKKNSIELPKNVERRRKSRAAGDSLGQGLGITGSDISGYARLDLTESAPEETKATLPADISPRVASDMSPNLTLSDGSPNLGLSDTSPNPALESKRSSGGFGGGRFIPTRESSLRHSYSGSPSAKRRSGRHSRYSSTGSKDMKLEETVPEDLSEADQVTRRIEELKAQKRLREETVNKESRRKDEESRPKDKDRISNPPVVSPRRSSHHSPHHAHHPRQISAVTVEEALTNVQAKRRDDIVEDVDSAPAPAVARLNRMSTGPLTATAGNIQSTPQRPSHDLHRAQTDPPQQRTSSRLKRYSRPVSPPHSEKHERTYSGALSPAGRQSVYVERPSSADSIDHAVQQYIDSPRLTQRIPHPQNGRMIAFSEVGDPSGYAVICCVGMGLTRYLTAFYDELAWTLKLRLITPDRPGVGESEPIPDGSGTPLGWADDVSVICNYLKVTKFSMLAHSAGAIYALATALRMPQHMRGRLHLLAPWIPPSQMSGPGAHKEALPAVAVPYSQRILRALPTPFLKAANSSFMSATSASISSALPKSPRKTKRKSTSGTGRETPALRSETPGVTNPANKRNSIFNPQPPSETMPSAGPATEIKSPTSPITSTAANDEGVIDEATLKTLEKLRQNDYDNRLTHAIWDHATTNANPAVDLLVCLERRQPIGFRYVDITRAVVIHHGTRDTRVPVDNVKWLGKTMRRCEVRILEGEGHGLMASAGVMGNILMEIAKEWEDWSVVTGRKTESHRRKSTAWETGYI